MWWVVGIPVGENPCYGGDGLGAGWWTEGRDGKAILNGVGGAARRWPSPGEGPILHWMGESRLVVAGHLSASVILIAAAQKSRRAKELPIQAAVKDVTHRPPNDLLVELEREFYLKRSKMKRSGPR